MHFELKVHKNMKLHKILCTLNLNCIRYYAVSSQTASQLMQFDLKLHNGVMHFEFKLQNNVCSLCSKCISHQRKFTWVAHKTFEFVFKHNKNNDNYVMIFMTIMEFNYVSSRIYIQEWCCWKLSPTVGGEKTNAES
jgi:hypothetical protein